MRKQELHPRTEITNKKQKLKSKKAKEDALHWLALRFPNAFDNTLKIHPLKLGIMNDILAYANEAAAAGISKSKLREAVVVYTRRIDYLASLKARDVRVDLLGNHISAVTETEAERAAVKIKKRVEKCAKMARQNIANKPLTPALQRSNIAFNNSEDSFPYYPERSGSWNTQPAVGKVTPVVVKNKSSKPFDPDAVARLKEKLGLSRTKEKEEAK